MKIILSNDPVRIRAEFDRAVSIEMLSKKIYREGKRKTPRGWIFGMDGALWYSPTSRKTFQPTTKICNEDVYNFANNIIEHLKKRFRLSFYLHSYLSDS